MLVAINFTKPPPARNGTHCRNDILDVVGTMPLALHSDLKTTLFVFLDVILQVGLGRETSLFRNDQETILEVFGTNSQLIVVKQRMPSSVVIPLSSVPIVLTMS